MDKLICTGLFTGTPKQFLPALKAAINGEKAPPAKPTAKAKTQKTTKPGAKKTTAKKAVKKA